MDDTKRKKNVVLVVDDEPDILNLTQKFLALGEIETITCTNAKEGIKVIEERYNEISIVLLDLMMPGPSGYSVLEEIKNNDLYKHIKVVLFTVKSFNEDIQKGKRMGADGYITKPFSGKELVKYVQSMLVE